ncbi:hypothetical protein [Streptomyces diastatochromogenes]|uniref:hypothetical protein n=1 Tax=Streptomyces diastatochromogenes TaxID=42236 RepID=UPI0036A6281A
MTTVQITEEQVRDAETRAEAAEEARVVAARKLEASPYSDVAAMEHAEAARAAAQQRANAREIRQAYQVQLEEERRRASRPALEKAAAVEIRQAGQDMDGRRKALAEAAAAAQAALVALADAGVAYNEGLAGHVQVLAGAGLDFGGGESGGERSVINVDRLKVKGQEYHPVDPGAVAVWVLRRVVEARLSSYHPMVATLEWTWRDVNARQPALVQKVPAPPAKAFPEPPRLRMPNAG